MDEAVARDIPVKPRLAARFRVGRVLVDVRVSVLALLAGLVVVAWMLAVAVGLYMSYPKRLFDARPPVVIGLVVLYVAGMAAHEAGHVVGGWIAGMRLTYVQIGAGAGIHVAAPDGGDVKTCRQQLTVSVFGPAAQITCGAVALAVTAAVAWWPAAAMAAVVALEGVLNVAVPFGRRTDAAKIYRCLWAVAHGRGGTVFHL